VSRRPTPNCRTCAERTHWYSKPVVCAACLRRVHRQEQDWYRSTGHCGYCGQPGVFCLCTDREPCGCRELHLMGSGLLAAALEQFAEHAVSPDQAELFGGDE